MKRTVLIFILGFSLLTIGCKNSNSEEIKEEMSDVEDAINEAWMDERNEAEAEMTQMKNDMTEQMQKIDTEIAESKTESKVELENQQAKLNDRMGELEMKMDRLKNASSDNWEEIKSDFTNWKNSL